MQVTLPERDEFAETREAGRSLRFFSERQGMKDDDFRPVHSFTLGSLASPPLDYEIGSTRLFGSADIAQSGLISGWSAQEPSHNWSDGDDTCLVLRTQDVPLLPCVLAVEGSPFLAKGVGRQRVTFYANGHRLGFWDLTESRLYVLEASVEPEYWLRRDGGGVLNLVWHLPDAVKPIDLGQGEDHRKLGFCFRSMTIDVYPS
jgi:hypothetical protein